MHEPCKKCGSKSHRTSKCTEVVDRAKLSKYHTVTSNAPDVEDAIDQEQKKFGHLFKEEEEEDLIPPSMPSSSAVVDAGNASIGDGELHDIPKEEGGWETMGTNDIAQADSWAVSAEHVNVTAQTDSWAVSAEDTNVTTQTDSWAVSAEDTNVADVSPEDQW